MWKWFSEKKGKEIEDPKPIPVKLDKIKKLYHEDNFARAPQINMVWPTVEQYHDDAYALNFLAQILSDGKKAPMYKVLVKDKELTSRTSAYNNAMELAGMFRINISANQGKSLDEIEKAIFESFETFISHDPETDLNFIYQL